MDNTDEMYKFFNDMWDKSMEENFINSVKNTVKTQAENFLDEVVNQIEKRKVIDSGILRDSFIKGDPLNIWIEKDKGLGISIETGTMVDYAAAVDHGHKTCPDGVAERWVPGYWLGTGKDAKFVYDRFSKTGMLLKQQWIDAKPYFTMAQKNCTDEWQETMDKFWDEWINRIFM